ncbi:MAG: nuclear transport factor 2 family protein [Hyphomicrobiales bacterium]|nr:nuclear transport factor 2 family protein [Hyphomicrobiales bacterium]MBV9426987.1 nuclear transport factor 2 family protein [Bradyrhizobiaceae bacterium]
MNDFPALLRGFAAAVVANDGAALAGLFTDDGVYEDGFFGAHKGRDEIVAMLARFHATGADYRWDFFDPLSDGRIGYARWRFSYASKMPGAEGKPVLFEGMSLFEFRGDRIARYSEAFDRGVALVQQDFPAERLRKILVRTAQARNATPACRAHLARFAEATTQG